jgi:quercetin dioxygenase-like cupin family protein
MDPYFAQFIPLEKQREPRAHVHAGFEFLYVLDGELDLRHGENHCTLGPGDSVYFDASTPHSYLCAGKRPADVLIVTMHQPMPQPVTTMRPGIPRALPGAAAHVAGR